MCIYPYIFITFWWQIKICINNVMSTNIDDSNKLPGIIRDALLKSTLPHYHSSELFKKGAWPHLPISWICHITVWRGPSSHLLYRVMSTDVVSSFPLPHCLCAHGFCVSDLKSRTIRKSERSKKWFGGPVRAAIRVRGRLVLSSAHSRYRHWSRALGAGYFASFLDLQDVLIPNCTSAV